MTGLEPGDVVTHTDGRTGWQGNGEFITYLTFSQRGDVMESTTTDLTGWSPAVVLPHPPEGHRHVLITDWMARDLRHGAFGLLSDEFVALNPEDGEQ